MINFFKIFSIQGIIQQYKRLKYSQSFKINNLHVSIRCVIKESRFGNFVWLGEKVTVLNSFIDDYSYVNSNSKLRNTTIGKFCSIGPNVQIVLGKHPSNLVSSHPMFYSNNKPFKTFSDKTYINEFDNVEIGHDVWIGEGVLIPGGIKVGNGAIITARSVVTKDVEPYSIVGGVPAKHIKFRFEESFIKDINNSEWWNWDSVKLRDNFKLFHDHKLFCSYLLKND